MQKFIMTDKLLQFKIYQQKFEVASVIFGPCLLLGKGREYKNLQGRGENWEDTVILTQFQTRPIQEFQF